MPTFNRKFIKLPPDHQRQTDITAASVKQQQPKETLLRPAKPKDTKSVKLLSNEQQSKRGNGIDETTFVFFTKPCTGKPTIKRVEVLPRAESTPFPSTSQREFDDLMRMNINMSGVRGGPLFRKQPSEEAELTDGSDENTNWTNTEKPSATREELHENGFRGIPIWWVKPHLKNEIPSQFGAYHTVFIYFKLCNHEEFIEFMHMNTDAFSTLYDLMEQRLRKQTTNFREPLDPELKLAFVL
ncbi:hypothetical protein TSAR_014070, partial [Trichomalopsis sarcophagae]